uniref:Biopolymer transport proteins n=1 Tax=uncultured delta proteobacterium HF0010_08B07 TaxID=710821 RepID=E0XWW0_9DELT|nr:biopolymer transport proteins [uncultured delta proteobacterium HF0010_08B07]
MNIIQTFEKFAELGAEWVMWLMLILGFGMIIIAIERLLLLSKTKVDAPDIARKLVDFLDRGQAAQAKQSLTDGLSMEQRVLADGLSQYQRGAVYVEQIMLSTLARERQRYNRYLNYFGTIGNNTPFIGLFGTVIGIILAFKKLGENPKGGLEVIGPLISEALVATAVGLFVAIPAVVIFNWFKSMVKERISNTDFLMRIVLAHLGEARRKEVQPLGSDLELNNSQSTASSPVTTKDSLGQGV